MKVVPHPSFEGVYYSGKRLATKALDKTPVYGEEFVDCYRIWNPYRSKPAAAIFKGLKNFPFKKRDKILYLGAANGTTASHLSDVVGQEGRIYCVEFSPRAMRDLVLVCENRKNMVPILSDANFPEKYSYIGTVDGIYQDVAQPNQGEIFLKNSGFLRKGGYGVLMAKSRSTDVTLDPKDVYKKVKKEIESRFEVIEMVELGPYQKDHSCFICRLR